MFLHMTFLHNFRSDVPPAVVAFDCRVCLCAQMFQGFGDTGFHMSFGIGAFPFGFFTTVFNANDPFHRAGTQRSPNQRGKKNHNPPFIQFYFESDSEGSFILKNDQFLSTSLSVSCRKCISYFVKAAAPTAKLKPSS